jgi:hypothetical protein
MTDAASTFNNSSFLSDFWLHALIIIPVEFGILHSTPLGPLLSGWFEGLWSAAGFEFAGHTAEHVVTEAIADTAAATIPAAPPPSFATPITPGNFCHLHGTELVCH